MNITKEDVLNNLEQVKKYIQEAENKKEEKVVGVAIKNRFTGNVIFQSTKTTYKDAVNECVAEARKKGTRADLTGADLAGADLTDADLTRTNLVDADLTGADLTGTKLAYTDLTDADLTRTNLVDADLTGADLTGADLTDADLTDADLTDADLTACLFFFGNGNRNFEALCRAIKTIKHPDGKAEQWIK